MAVPLDPGREAARRRARGRPEVFTSSTTACRSILTLCAAGVAAVRLVYRHLLDVGNVAILKQEINNAHPK